jgi:hypothetical protein
VAQSIVAFVTLQVAQCHCRLALLRCLLSLYRLSFRCSLFCFPNAKRIRHILWSTSAIFSSPQKTSCNRPLSPSLPMGLPAAGAATSVLPNNNFLK